MAVNNSIRVTIALQESMAAAAAAACCRDEGMAIKNKRDRGQRIREQTLTLQVLLR